MYSIGPRMGELVTLIFLHPTPMSTVPVIVKKSSLKNLSADCWLSVGCLLVFSIFLTSPEPLFLDGFQFTQTRTSDWLLCQLV